MAVPESRLVKRRIDNAEILLKRIKRKAQEEEKEEKEKNKAVKRVAKT